MPQVRVRSLDTNPGPGGLDFRPTLYPQTLGVAEMSIVKIVLAGLLSAVVSLLLTVGYLWHHTLAKARRLRRDRCSAAAAPDALLTDVLADPVGGWGNPLVELATLVVCLNNTAGCAIQARFWLERGSSTARQSVP